MGILDEAIREHLELKRQHGAEEKEIEGLEAEAFGPADRPDAIEPETRVITPDQESAEATAETAAPPASEAPAAEPAKDVAPESGAAPEAESGEPASAEASSAPPDAAEAPAPEAAAPAEAAPKPEEPMPPAEPEGATVPEVVGVEPSRRVGDYVEYDDDEGDAGDMLEAERQRLASHPTEHYDVDAAIAEEDELDILSESSLSDELDRALEGPVEPVSEEFAADPESDDEPVTADPPREGAEEEIEDAEYEAVMETAPEDEPEDERLEEQEEPEAEAGDEPEDDDSAAAFFDQEDPLEGTPDFLEETPDHDRLWFEQREPKDFDFGD